MSSDELALKQRCKIRYLSTRFAMRQYVACCLQRKLALRDGLGLWRSYQYTVRAGLQHRGHHKGISPTIPSMVGTCLFSRTFGQHRPTQPGSPILLLHGMVRADVASVGLWHLGPAIIGVDAEVATLVLPRPPRPARKSIKHNY